MLYPCAATDGYLQWSISKSWLDILSAPHTSGIFFVRARPHSRYDFGRTSQTQQIHMFENSIWTPTSGAKTCGRQTPSTNGFALGISGVTAPMEYAKSPSSV